MTSNNIKIAIIGAGNLGCSIAEGLVNAKICEPEQIYLTRRNLSKIKQYESGGFNVTASNEIAVKASKYIFLCVQPSQIDELLQGLDHVLDAEKHILISTITGVTTTQIERNLDSGSEFAIIGSMPNTAVAVGESMTCLYANKQAKKKIVEVESMFKALGDTLIIEESMMQAATVLAASGIAFFMRYIRAATQGGIQLGFDAADAQKIATQTAKGAATLLIKNGGHPEIQIDKVTTPKGCTIAGLNEMEFRGLSSALIKGIIASYEKISTLKS